MDLFKATLRLALYYLSCGKYAGITMANISRIGEQ